MITQEQLKELMHYDPITGVFKRRKCLSPKNKPGDIVGYLDSKGYMYVGIRGKNYRLHRLAWLYMYGTWPRDQIDHINRKRTDNRLSNLREVTNKENMLNTSRLKNNTSGVTGVSWHKADAKWRAHIKVDGRYIHLGNFTDKRTAIAARKAAERLHGFHPNHGTKHHAI